MKKTDVVPKIKIFENHHPSRQCDLSFNTGNSRSVITESLPTEPPFYYFQIYSLFPTYRTSLSNGLAPNDQPRFFSTPSSHFSTRFPRLFRLFSDREPKIRRLLYLFRFQSADALAAPIPRFHFVSSG